MTSSALCLTCALVHARHRSLFVFFRCVREPSHMNSRHGLAVQPFTGDAKRVRHLHCFSWPHVVKRDLVGLVGRIPAPIKDIRNPGIHDSPINSNKQWFAMVP